MIELKLFYYNQLIKATENYSDLRNLPMYDNIIKVYKNTNIKLALSVRRLDRRVLKITQDKRYFLNILSQDGQYNLVRKQFNPEDIEHGRFSIELDRLDLDILKVGRYNYSVTYIDSSSNEYPLFLTQNAEAVGEIHVLENVLPITLPPYVQFDFTKIRTLKGTDYPNSSLIQDTYVSSRLPINNELHTLKLILDNFSGIITIQSTRNPDPNDQESWKDFNTFEYTNETITEDIILSDLNFEFIRVKFEYLKTNEGKVTEIQFY